MKIRQLTIDDTLLWKHNRLQALIDHPENYLSSYEEEIKLSDQDWQKRITDNAIFGVFENQNLLSMVSFSILPRLKSKHIGEIWGVYTLASERGKGYSKQLMQYVLDYAKDKVEQCILTCTTTNTGAFHLYKKLGFSLYGTDTKSIKVSDSFFDEYLMVKDLKLQAQKIKAMDIEPKITKNPTLHHFSLLKNSLGKSSDIKQLFNDCINHDLSGPSIWQSIIHYFRLLCFYVFKTGRYYELDIMLSTLSTEETRQLKFALDTSDIQAYMTCNA